jgi:hypothetical protein
MKRIDDLSHDIGLEGDEYEIRELTEDEIISVSGGQALYDRAPSS